jgi:hypothetical protein
MATMASARPAVSSRRLLGGTSVRWEPMLRAYENAAQRTSSRWLAQSVTSGRRSDRRSSQPMSLLRTVKAI